jgi:Concanavalin A-like lectin/glucanases superfamily
VETNLIFDGQDDFIEIQDAAAFSLAATGQLTVSAWIRPDVLNFPTFEGTGYVHWMGKGEPGRHEWVFRMYNKNTTDNPPRPNRISFYLFNPGGGEGIGSHVQEPVQAGEWIHIVGVADETTTAIYKNGMFKDCDRYTGTGPGPCHTYPSSQWITPMHGTAPLRIGTRDRKSFFLGAMRNIKIWNRALAASEISLLHGGAVPQVGLVAAYLLNRDIAIDSMGLRNGTVHGASWIVQ